MCSVIDLIDKQKCYIKSKQKTIQSLYEFLDSIDKPFDKKIESNVDKKQIHSKAKPIQSNGNSDEKRFSVQKTEDSNNLMFATKGLLNYSDSQETQKRQKLSEERRREYNQFLLQKKVDFDNSKGSSRRVSKVIPDYNDILNAKRIEELKHRQLNGLDDIEGFNLSNGMSGLQIGKQFAPLQTIGYFHCSNNKYVDEYIVPRSRLLASHSSRLRAAKYSEELRKQIEEKEKLKAIEREKIRLEEEELERKLAVQRKRMLEEFEAEHRLKADLNSDKDEMSRELVIGSTSPISLMRSPTYLHSKDTKHLDSRSPKKSKNFSRSLASELSQTMGTQSMATQTSEEHKHYMASDDSSEDEFYASSEGEEPEDKNEDKTKEAEFRKRVLSQLSEVRQVMESDHIRLMEQLRQQQLSQIDH